MEKIKGQYTEQYKFDAKNGKTLLVYVYLDSFHYLSEFPKRVRLASAEEFAGA